MKILRIGGKNLASLAGEFEVDFEASRWRRAACSPSAARPAPARAPCSTPSAWPCTTPRRA